jgi:hypothetical protein
MLYSIVPRPTRPGRWKESVWMQLDLGFHERPEARVWERLDNQQRVAAVQALTRLILKASKNNAKEDNGNAGHE